MKILSWNVRGAARKLILPFIRDLVCLHDIQVLIMIETKVTAERASRILAGIGTLFAANELSFGNGFSGGI